MTDMFDEMIWCKECRTEMKKVLVNKDGFQLRALQCIKCGKRIYHPNDVEEFKRFSQLRQRPFEVKLRMVGNSYAVSIPREIIDFLQTQENMHKQIQDKMRDKVNEMVKLSLEESGRISLCFGKEVVKIEHRDSEHPEKNKSITIEKTYHPENPNKPNVKVTQEKPKLNKIKLKSKRIKTEK